eukprot:scaffold78879_cov34-Cyclotella_meneghiniana.AAC.2
MEPHSLQQHHDRTKSDVPKPSACLSPANSVFSACSQSTALTRVRNQIEGRRQSRAAARARIDAALNDIEAQVTPKYNKGAVNQFSSRNNENSTNSESSEDIVLEEGRQPNGILPQIDQDDEEEREDNEETTDRVGQVITVENISSPVSVDSEKARSPKEKKRNNQRDDAPKKADPPADIEEPFKETEDLSLIEPSTEAQSTPTVKDSTRKERKSKDKKKRQSRSGRKSLVKEDEPVITQSSFGLTEEALLAMSQAAFEAAQENEETKDADNVEQFQPIHSPSSKSRSSASSKQEQSKTQVSSPSSKSKNSLSSSGPADELCFVSSQPKNKISSPPSSVDFSHPPTHEVISVPLIDIQEDPTKEKIEGNEVKEKNEAKTPRSIVQTMSEASTQVYTHLFARDYPTPRASNESPLPNPKTTSQNNFENSINPSASAAQNQDTRSEGTSSGHDSFASSTSSTMQNEQPVNEEIEKKPSEIDKELGALDSIMFQQKGLGQLEVTTTGMTDNSNNSQGSGNSSYSSENTRDLSPNKSMGPIWQKAIDDAQKVLTPTKATEKKSTELVHDEDETFEDNDDTLVSVRPGFVKERMQYTGAWAAGIVSSVALLALTIEMNTNSPVSVKSSKEGEASIVENFAKFLAGVGLGPGDEQETKLSRRKRKKKRKSKILLENATDDEATMATTDTLQNRSSEYMPPDIGV